MKYDTKGNLIRDTYIPLSPTNFDAFLLTEFRAARKIYVENRGDMNCIMFIQAKRKAESPNMEWSSTV